MSVFLYRIILCYIVYLIIVSNLMMAKSEMTETCSRYIMYSCNYSCVTTAMPMHNYSSLVGYSCF